MSGFASDFSLLLILSCIRLTIKWTDNFRLNPATLNKSFCHDTLWRNKIKHTLNISLTIPFDIMDKVQKFGATERAKGCKTVAVVTKHLLVVIFISTAFAGQTDFLNAFGCSSKIKTFFLKKWRLQFHWDGAKVVFWARDSPLSVYKQACDGIFHSVTFSLKIAP